jgi:hypothetical protein
MANKRFLNVRDSDGMPSVRYGGKARREWRDVHVSISGHWRFAEVNCNCMVVILNVPFP